MAEALIQDLLVILTAGLVAGLISSSLGTSVLVGYLIVGTLIGDGALGLISDERHEIERVAEAGVFLLLFSIGLEFSLDELWRLGRNLLIGGSVQMGLVVLPISGFLLAAGTGWQAALLVAAATSFSSTVLVFKALSECGHSSLPHGRRAIGILLFQDAALVPLLLLVPLLTGRGDAAGWPDYVRLVLTSTLFVAAVIGIRWVLAKWVIPLFAGYRSPELVVLFTLVCLGGVTWVAYRIELPPAIGAFAAGLIFSGNRWTKQIDALVLPFRETFAAIFFVSLGLLFNPELLLREPITMLVCLAGLMGIKAIAATVALRLTGLTWTSAAGMGAGLAHVGEFAFVLVLLGSKSGVISANEYQRVVAIAVGSLILTPLLLRKGLARTESHQVVEAGRTEGIHEVRPGAQAVVIGAGPIGRQVTSRLETTGHDVCLIDLSPINLHPYAQEGFRTIAGDAIDSATLAAAEAQHAAVVVICVPDDDVAARVVRKLREVNRAALVLVRCRFQVNAGKLRNGGADEVVSEEAVAGNALLQLLDAHGKDRPMPTADRRGHSPYA